jgi:hypothetical protein
MQPPRELLLVRRLEPLKLIGQSVRRDDAERNARFDGPEALREPWQVSGAPQ